MRRWRLAGVASLLGLVLAGPGWAAPGPETLETRLLRTIQIGVPQQITVAEIKRTAVSDSDYSTVLLARSALFVLRQDSPRPIAYEELLEGALNKLVRGTSAFLPPPGLPDFRGKETVLAMVYAMVMSGNEARAVGVLERHLMSGSRYKQAIVLQALRNIGSPRAIGLIQKYAESGEDRNLAQTTLADEDFPVFVDLYQRWGMVPPAERQRGQLLALVRGGCNQRAAMAAYWLGFFPPSPDARAEQAELDALKAMLGKSTPTCQMMEHVIALKSLALRSAETVEFWASRARATANVWERHQIVLNAFGRWGRQFAPAALELLQTEPTQYVQWELMHGNLQTRQGRLFRDYWDIWIPVNVLVVLDGAEDAARARMQRADLDALLAWLEAGRRPRDPWVANHMLYNMAGLVADDDTRRYLRLFNAHPKRNENFWIINNLRDPQALPLLRYWETLPAPKDQAEQLKALIGRLESKSATAREVNLCCQPTEACLIERLSAAALPATTAIRSEDDARRWLAQKAAEGGGYLIRYTDGLKRAAVVQLGDGAEERWEYLYDCWRNTTPGAGLNLSR